MSLELVMGQWGYLLPALVGGIGVALLAGPMGSMMVWRRLSYFGDTLAHSGLLGVTVALIAHFNLTLGMMLVATIIAILLWLLLKNKQMPSDALLGLLSHTTLALGLLLLSLNNSIRFEVMSLLVGDILAITWQQVGLIYLFGVILLLILSKLWQPLLRATIDKELAQAEGVPEARVALIYLILLALVIAMAIQLVGVLLITALLIIPAITARWFAKSPERMAHWASGLGVLAIFLGLGLSLALDVPTGPAIVVCSAMVLFISLLVKQERV